jgi:hypothetical protein
MTGIEIVAAITAFLVLIYLLWAMLRPEDV